MSNIIFFAVMIPIMIIVLIGCWKMLERLTEKPTRTTKNPNGYMMRFMPHKHEYVWDIKTGKQKCKWCGVIWTQ